MPLAPQSAAGSIVAGSKDTVQAASDTTAKSNSPPRIIALQRMAKKLNAQPSVVALRVQATKLAAPAGSSTAEAPLQRQLTVAGAQIAELPANVDPGAHAALIAEWIAADNLVFRDWQEVLAVAGGGAAALATHRAVQWLRGKGWNLDAANIVNSALTAQNCHGLTFGVDWAEFATIGQFLARWEEDGSARVLLCLKGNQVAHSARFEGGSWRQTLPGGPIFTCTRQQVAEFGGYTCYDLSIQGERAAVTQIGNALVEEYNQQRQVLIDLCTDALGNADADLAYYSEAWLEEAQEEQEYSPENMATISSRIEQMNEMLGN